jgi:predicted transcriptional regulator
MSISGEAVDGDFALKMASRIVAAYVANNHASHAQLIGLIAELNGVFLGIAHPVRSPENLELTVPAVPIRESITDDYLTCLECGSRLTSLKRHLKAKHSLSPQQYRVKWRLRTKYPMVCPAYSKHRSRIAKTLGLGRANRT